MEQQETAIFGQITGEKDRGNHVRNTEVTTIPFLMLQ